MEPLSIVIPCKNEEKFIGNTLGALVNQSGLSPGVPIIIADAGSTDRTLSIISEYSKRLNIQVVPGGIPSVGRNRGAAHTNSKYILFIDADVIPAEPDTISKTLAMAMQKDLDLVSTRIRILQGNLADKFFWRLYTIAAKTKIVGAFAGGMFFLIKTETFRKLGGFNEHITLGEDWDLTHKIDPKKFEISDSYVTTTNRRFFAQGYLKTFYEYFMVAASSGYRHREHSEYFETRFK